MHARLLLRLPFPEASCTTNYVIVNKIPIAGCVLPSVENPYYIYMLKSVIDILANFFFRGVAININWKREIIVAIKYF